MATNAEVMQIAIPQLQQDEGLRLTAYPDPLSGAEPWTIGYGCTGADIGPGTVWTQEQADQELESRVASLSGDLDGQIPWWRGLDAVRAAVLLEMAFQLGLFGLLAFQHMLAAAQTAQWAQAADEMRASHWAEQTPNRANRLASQMWTGTVQ